mgnify:CR=1 FL=1
MQVKDFTYELPQELIAQYPLEPRDHSRLLVVDKNTGTIEHRYFYDLCEYLRHDDLLVFNDTRVIPARLHGVKDTGARVEVFLLTRLNSTDWEVLVKPGRKLRVGAKIKFSDDLSCDIIADTDFGGRIARFYYNGVFEEILDRLGETPLPPYITHQLEDKNRYQTGYAKHTGSAAAPTAGLHFTPELLKKVKEMGVEIAEVTLHVGLGTFRPVKETDVLKHHMHSEFYRIEQSEADKINHAKETGHRVIAVGTTSTRTLEAASDENGFLRETSGWTEIFIYPGYRFKVIDSTLVMLVSALAGREHVLNAYEIAVQEKYRFFSFGDAMLITDTTV